MKYISVKQAADNWGVSARQVQMLLKNDRIAGAVRFDNHAWMIPADAEKPGDPRLKKQKPPQKSLSSELDKIIEATMLPMPRDNPDAILDNVREERLRLLYESELAYLRGDFEQVINLFKKTEGDDAAKLRACSTATAAAMSVGNYTLYKEIETYLKNIIKANMGENVTAVATLSLDIAYVSTGAPDMASEWLKSGNFTALPIQARLVAALHRSNYYHCLGKFEHMLAVAQTALSFCDTERKITTQDIYLRIVCAKACCGLNRIDEARCYLSDAVNICFPHGFIAPFVEATVALGGLLEKYIEQKFPAQFNAVIRQWERVAPNWVMFHNQFTKDNLKVILTPRESEIALLAGRRIPYKLIAEQFNLSIGSVKNAMQIIYEKLYINNRDDLYKLHLEP